MQPKIVAPFADSIEGNIARGILRFLDRHPKYRDWIAEEKLPDSDTCEIVYEAMDAEQWIESAYTEDTTFAYICSHDPKQMFTLAYQIAVLSLRL